MTKGDTDERVWQIHGDGMEPEVRPLADGAVRVQKHGGGKAAVPRKLSDAEADQGVSTEEWVIVRHGEDNSTVLVRKKYQWEAGIYNTHWEYLAEGLTEEQAKQYEKLLKE